MAQFVGIVCSTAFDCCLHCVGYCSYLLLLPAIVFLTCDKTEPDRMQLWIVSRTQGRDYHEYIFLDGSNYGMTIYDTIAAEAAGLAYEEIRQAAWDLRLNDLWKKLVGPRRKGDDVSEEDVEELLVLIPPMPLLYHLDTVDKDRITMVVGSGINWLICCAAMEKEPAFSPFHAFTTSDSRLHLFYVKEEDLFLVFRLSLVGELNGLSLLCREENLIKERKHTLVVQKLINYLLHYLWFAI
jgi:hypothetical protein